MTGNVPQDVPQDVAQDVAQDDVEDSIRKLVKANNKITRQQMADKIGVSKKTVERKIKEMESRRGRKAGLS